MRVLNIAVYLCEISIIMGPCRNSIVDERGGEKRDVGIARPRNIARARIRKKYSARLRWIVLFMDLIYY